VLLLPLLRWLRVQLQAEGRSCLLHLLGLLRMEQQQGLL
jgi:hypothetical protein